MPKLSQSMADRQAAAVRARIAAYVDDRQRVGWDIERIAKSLGFSESTLLRRRRDPQRLTLMELQSVASTMNITIATLISPMGEIGG